MEMTFGLGYALGLQICQSISIWTQQVFIWLGPAVGSALYSLGGFSLPYFTIGGAVLIFAIVNALIIPSLGSQSDKEENVDDDKLKLLNENQKSMKIKDIISVGFHF